MLPPEALTQLKGFLNLVKKSPQLLHSPELSFFKEFIQSFGGTVPPCAEKPQTESKPKESAETKPEPEVNESEEEEVESDVELDNTGVIGMNELSILSCKLGRNRFSSNFVRCRKSGRCRRKWQRNTFLRRRSQRRKYGQSEWEKTRGHQLIRGGKLRKSCRSVHGSHQIQSR